MEMARGDESLASTLQAGNKVGKALVVDDAPSVVSHNKRDPSKTAALGDNSVSSTHFAAKNSGEPVSLESLLLKQGSRTKAWHNRFFALRGIILSYYDDADGPNPKGTFVISNEAGCEVGNLYIDQRQVGSKKELIYCLKITWSTLEPALKEKTHETPSPESPGTISLVDEDISPQTPDPTLSQAGSPIRDEIGALLEPKSTGKRPKIRFRSSKKTKEDKFRTPSRPPMPSKVSRSRTDGRPRSQSEATTSLLGNTVQYVSPVPRRGSSASVQPIRDDQSEIESPPNQIHRRIKSDGSFSSLAEHLATPNLNESSEVMKSDELPLLLPRNISLPDRSSSGNVIPAEKTIPHQLVSDPRRDQSLQEQRLLQSLFYATKRANKRKTRKMLVDGTKIAAAASVAVTLGVLTVGVGLLAGLVFIGGAAAAGGTGVAAGAGYMLTKKKQGEIVIATSNYELARQWKGALDACLTSETVKKTTWGQMFAMEGRNTASAVLPTSVDIGGSRSRDSAEEWTGRRDEKPQVLIDPATIWRPMECGWATLLGTGAHGLRIFREERASPRDGFRTKLSVEGQPNPPLKGQAVLNATALDSFMCLMSLPRIPLATGMRLPIVPNSGQRASFRIIESIDEHMDIIHLVFHPLFLFPSWTSPRDFVLFRYWRLDPNGTYVICYDSIEHALCPPHQGYTRGDMNGVYTISPRKKTQIRANPTDSSALVPECLVTALVQVDPHGWVPNKPVPILANQGYGEAFAVSALLQLLDIRDALDYDRFVPLVSDVHELTSTPHPNDFGLRAPNERGPFLRSRSLDSSIDEDDDPINYDFTYAMRESHGTEEHGDTTCFAHYPPPLPLERWAEPDANSFRVRGKFYKTDKRKFNAGSSIGRLIAVDVVWVEKMIATGMCNHPTERMQLALEREQKLKERGLESDLPPFMFVVNICLPGPPVFHGVFYYTVDDMSSIDGSDGTPSSKLCKEFFFGDSDEFRDKTFKLIPQIVEGNFIVRKAVGSTPAIMGTKLKMTYARSDRFCEVVLDCGSSSVATGVIRLSLGYCQELVVDMGFLFEGKEESTLPERIFGAARIKNLLFGKHLRFVEQPPESSTP